MLLTPTLNTIESRKLLSDADESAHHKNIVRYMITMVSWICLHHRSPAGTRFNIICNVIKKLYI